MEGTLDVARAFDGDQERLAAPQPPQRRGLVITNSAHFAFARKRLGQPEAYPRPSTLQEVAAAAVHPATASGEREVGGLLNGDGVASLAPSRGLLNGDGVVPTGMHTGSRSSGGRTKHGARSTGRRARHEAQSARRRARARRGAR